MKHKKTSKLLLALLVLGGTFLISEKVYAGTGAWNIESNGDYTIPFGGTQSFWAIEGLATQGIFLGNLFTDFTYDRGYDYSPTWDNVNNVLTTFPVYGLATTTFPCLSNSNMSEVAAYVFPLPIIP